MTRTHDDMRENAVSPLRDQRGVPFCSTDGCPQYDGKRCKALGFQVRGGSVCEVAVIELLTELTRLTSALAEAERERDAAREHGTSMVVAYNRELSRAQGAEYDVACLRAQVADLTRERDAAVREADRWRHGRPIEGDYVCPADLERDRLRALLGECLDIWRARRAAPPTMSDFAACERLDAIAEEAGLDV